MVPRRVCPFNSDQKGRFYYPWCQFLLIHKLISRLLIMERDKHQNLVSGEETARNDITKDSNEPSIYDIRHRCEVYHMQHFRVQIIILKHRSMIDFLDYLEDSLYESYPFINYPQPELLKLILTATTVTKWSLSDPQISASIVPKAHSRPLSNRSTDYLTSLLLLCKKLGKNRDLKSLDDEIYFYELKNLWKIMSSLLHFITKSNSLGRRSVSDKIYCTKERQGAEDNDLNTTANQEIQKLRHLNEEEWFSRQELFGNSNFDKLGRPFWEYFLWGFKCCIKGSIHNDQVSQLTWSTWKNALFIITEYYKIEWQILCNSGVRFHDAYAGDRYNSYFLRNVFSLWGSSASSCFSRLITISFMHSLDSLDRIRPIMESDLILRDTSNYIPNKKIPITSELGLETIYFRETLISLGYLYICLFVPKRRVSLQKYYCENLSKNLIDLCETDFRKFLSNCDLSIPELREMYKFTILIILESLTDIDQIFTKDTKTIIAEAEICHRNKPTEWHIPLLIHFIRAIDMAKR